MSAEHAVNAEVRLYDNLFREPFPEAEGHFLENINQDSLEVLTNAKLEPNINDVTADNRWQFMRHGYFCLDAKDSKPGALVINRTVTLKDSWAKLEAKGKK